MCIVKQGAGVTEIFAYVCRDERSCDEQATASDPSPAGGSAGSCRSHLKRRFTSHTVEAVVQRMFSLPGCSPRQLPRP